MVRVSGSVVGLVRWVGSLGLVGFGLWFAPVRAVLQPGSNQRRALLGSAWRGLRGLRMDLTR